MLVAAQLHHRVDGSVSSRMLNGKDSFNHVVMMGGTDASVLMKDGSKGTAAMTARLVSSTWVTIIYV